MHELSIATSIFETVEAATAKNGGPRCAKVGLRIGEMTAIDQGALSFSWECLTKETALENVPLEMEFCSRRHRCSECGEEFAVVDYEFACPRCQSMATFAISGDELDIAYIEVEE